MRAGSTGFSTESRENPPGERESRAGIWAVLWSAVCAADQDAAAVTVPLTSPKAGTVCSKGLRLPAFATSLGDSADAEAGNCGLRGPAVTGSDADGPRVTRRRRRRRQLLCATRLRGPLRPPGTQCPPGPHEEDGTGPGVSDPRQPCLVWGDAGRQCRWRSVRRVPRTALPAVSLPARPVRRGGSPSLPARPARRGGISHRAAGAARRNLFRRRPVRPGRRQAADALSTAKAAL